MGFADRDGVIWSNGELVPWREAKIHMLTHSLHYGLGVFEGVRAYQTPAGTCLFRLHEHTRRLFNSARIFNLKMPFDADTLIEAQKQVVRENGLAEAYIRPIVFLGDEAMGLRADQLQTNVMIAAWEWPSYMEPAALERGITVRTSSYARHHVKSTLSRAKACGYYINSILALQEAVASGAEEALMLDGEGFVSEGSGENFFMVVDGALHTPELTFCLDGVTRNTVITLARKAGYEVTERRITRDEVYICDEAFFTGTAAEVVPIRELDDRSIGNGSRGPLTELLQRTYFDLVRGRDVTNENWLVNVEKSGP